MSRVVAIVGRPNVGKSTLFNRLTGNRDAIEDATSGVTRDRHYGRVEWNGEWFTLIDTGGYVKGSDDIFEAEIRKQVQFAIEEADLLLFLVDIEEGLTPYDETVADMLRKNKSKERPVIMVANKVDNHERASQAAEFYSLGLGDVHTVSAISGSGTGDLLDDVMKQLITRNDEHYDESLPRIAVVGRPNVGKSSLINVLMGEDRQIVTEIAGTTRDAIDMRFTRFGHDVLLVDTAGVRKKSKVHEDIEFYSVMRSVKAIERCDICIIMIDATQGFEQQDMSIFSLAVNNNKGIVIVVNKWDLMDKQTNTVDYYSEMIRTKLAPFRDVPIVFTSVHEKQRLMKVLETAMTVHANRSKKIPTSKLNEAMLPIIELNPPPSYKGKYIRIKYLTQLPVPYPTFAIFCNLPQYVQENYKRFLENKFREKFDFTGVPVNIFFRKK
ncbi:MAG TPA: ribosome biogenesis GTPase Der [Bacteroidia bacterium]|jgi:GTP-binding protein|nr:ribosome biogenesis GTPase Der [Bacteroidia bacterium]